MTYYKKFWFFLKGCSRLRGEYLSSSDCHVLSMGSPPLTRGTHRVGGFGPGLCGITPAYAGNTHDTSFPSRAQWDHPRLRGEHPVLIGPRSRDRDHPRLRGEHHIPVTSKLFYLGSPPLTRGTLVSFLGLDAMHGITPAYAGNTAYSVQLHCIWWDHPRLRGEHSM